MVREDTAQPVVLRAVTDVGGLTHLVTDEAMAAGRRAGCVGVEWRSSTAGGCIAAMPGGMLRELYGYLVEDGLLEVHPADEHGTSRVGLTEAGQVRYVALCQARRAQLPAPCPEPATAPTDDPDKRRGWCVAPCGCSLEVPPDGAVYVDCPGCAPPGDRPDPPAEAVR